MSATNDRDDHDEWAEKFVRKIAEAERLGGGFRLHHEAAAGQIAALRREHARLLVACARTCEETDWCPACEHHPSRGHYGDCPLAEEREPEERR